MLLLLYGVASLINPNTVLVIVSEDPVILLSEDFSFRVSEERSSTEARDALEMTLWT